MARTLESTFEHEVAEAIGRLGYKVAFEPSGIPNRRLWQNDLASLVRGPRYTPDILVEHEGKFAIVEVKSRPVLLGGVMQAHKYANYFGVEVIICVPDDVYPSIPKSVKEFADYKDVGLCPLSEVGNALTTEIG